MQFDRDALLAEARQHEPIQVLPPELRDIILMPGSPERIGVKLFGAVAQRWYDHHGERVVLNVLAHKLPWTVFPNVFLTVADFERLGALDALLLQMHYRNRWRDGGWTADQDVEWREAYRECASTYCDLSLERNQAMIAAADPDHLTPLSRDEVSARVQSLCDGLAHH